MRAAHVSGVHVGGGHVEDQRVDLFDEAIVAPEVLTPLAVAPLSRGIVVVAIHFLYLPDDRRFVGRDVKVVGKGRALIGLRRRWNRTVWQLFPAGELADIVRIDKRNGEKERIASFLFEELGGFVWEVGVLRAIHG